MSLAPDALWLADYGVTESPFWASLVNVTAVGNSFTKTAGGSAWNASATSGRVIPADGSVSFRVGDAATTKVCGLAIHDPNPSIGDIDWAFYLDGPSSNFQVLENGAPFGLGTLYAAGDLFEVRRVGTTITYHHNGGLYYTSLAASSGPIFFDSSLYHAGCAINDVTISGDYPTASAWADLSGNGYDAAQATPSKRPMFDVAGGVAPRLVFDKARPDFLSGPVVPIGANPYSLVMVSSYTTQADWTVPIAIGTYPANGIGYVTGAAPWNTMITHVPLGLSVQVEGPSAALRSKIVRWDGANVLGRLAGVDNAPGALAAHGAPVGATTIASLAAGGNAVSMHCYMAAVFLRSLSDVDTDVCGQLFQQHYGIP